MFFFAFKAESTGTRDSIIRKRLCLYGCVFGTRPKEKSSTREGYIFVVQCKTYIIINFSLNPEKRLFAILKIQNALGILSFGCWYARDLNTKYLHLFSTFPEIVYASGYLKVEYSTPA